MPPGKTSGANDNKSLAKSPLAIIKGTNFLAENPMEDKRPEVRALAKEQYEMRFPPKQLEDTDDDFDFLDEK